MSSTSPSRHVLLIDSLPSESRTPRNVFELDSSQLRPLIKHLPDGEQNDRGGWFSTQIDPMQHSPFLEADSEPAWATGRTPETIAALYDDEIRQRPILLDYYTRGHKAYRCAPAFGVACECGQGRRPAGTTEQLLSLHREVAASL